MTTKYAAMTVRFALALLPAFDAASDYGVEIHRGLVTSKFGSTEIWATGLYSGAVTVAIADVTGDGLADLIIDDSTTVVVRRSNGSSFGAIENWTNGPYFGTRGTFFADVDGDGKADAIVVNDNTVTVRRSTGSALGPNEDWTKGPFFGSRGTFFADVDGDGRADAIAVNDDTLTVRRSTHSSFLLFCCWDWKFAPNEDWTNGPYFGNIGQSVFFADVDGDRRADAIVVNTRPVVGGAPVLDFVVRLSTGSNFSPNKNFTPAPAPPVGTNPNFFFAEVTAANTVPAGSLRMADSIVVFLP